MNNPAPDSIRTQQQRCCQMLIVLNGNRERNRLLFWVSLIVGLLLLIILSAAVSAYMMGVVAFVTVETLLGVAGLVGWLYAERKIARLQTVLAELEKANTGNPSVAASIVQPKPPQAAAGCCPYCGKPLVGARAFCQSCGKQQ